MPHYKDGSQAKVGDHVIGRLYNSGPEPKAGIIISITPGVESCNAQVQFTEARPVDHTGSSARPGMALAGDPRIVKGEAHGSSGPTFALYTCADYCATNELTKVVPAEATAAA